MKTLLKRLYWKLYIIVLSLKWIFKINLRSEVYYKGGKYIVLNGVMIHYWFITNDDNAAFWAKRKECKKVLSFKNIKCDFLSGYDFYMQTWFDIWSR